MSNFTLDQKRNLTKAEARHFARMFARDVKKRKAIGRIFIFIFSLLVIIFILLPLILGGDYCLLIIAGVSAPFLLLVIWDYSQVKKNAAANIEMLVSYREGTLRKETISEYAGGRNSIDVDYYFIDDLPIEIPSHWLMLDYLKEGKQYRFEYALRAQIDGLRNHGGGYVADNLTILKKGYLLSVDGYLSLDEELKKGWDHSENKDVIFPFVGALIFSIIFLVNLPGYLNNPSYKPEKLIQYLKYGKATENMVFAPDEIPFEKLRPYNQLNIKDALVINVMEGDNIRTILITNKDSFKKDFETLAADAAWLEGFIHPWTLSMGYYGWDDRDSLLDNNPFYQDLKKESMALVRRNNSILRKYIPYNKSSLIPEYIADEQQKILDQYYLPLKELEAKKLAERFQALIKPQNSGSVYLVGDGNTSGRSAFTFPKAENINFESKELRDHFDFLSELLQNSESWDISGFVYKINEKELLLDTGIERQYNSKELYKYAIFITVLGLLSIYSVILLLVRYKKITWNMNRIKSYYKKKIKRI